MQEEAKEQKMKEMNENATDASGKETGFSSSVNTDVEDPIASTGPSTIQKDLKESSNGCIAQGDEEIDTKISTIQIAPKKKGISWEPENKN